MTVADAIAQSGLNEQTQLPETLNLGIWGVKIHSPTHLLKAGDRVEIYLPLKINPKDIRRKRAEKILLDVTKLVIVLNDLDDKNNPNQMIGIIAFVSVIMCL